MSPRELNPATSSISDHMARGAAVDTGLCSDGKKCGVPPSVGDDAYCVECPNRPVANDLPIDEMTRNGMEQAAAKWERGDMDARSKYHREIKPGVWVDCYDVLQAWAVTNPALQHLIKKALQPGARGHKDLETDMNDIIASAKRAKDLEQ